jgi:hypothetical protein
MVWEGALPEGEAARFPGRRSRVFHSGRVDFFGSCMGQREGYSRFLTVLAERFGMTGGMGL